MSLSIGGLFRSVFLEKTADASPLSGKPDPLNFEIACADVTYIGKYNDNLGKGEATYTKNECYGNYENQGGWHYSLLSPEEFLDIVKGNCKENKLSPGFDCKDVKINNFESTFENPINCTHPQVE